jgi:uncharacterized protein (TIGR00297 family)
MLVPASQFLLIIVVLIILFFASLFFKLFDLKGSIGAVAVGAIVAFAANINWLLLLIVFAVVSHLVTKFKFEFKRDNKYQEGTKGERRISNVIYAGLIGVVIAVSSLVIPYKFPFFILFAAAFASITADTFASEIGVLDQRTYLITTFRRTTTGINGGISTLGEIAALIGSFSIAISYTILTRSPSWFGPFLLILISGFLGCQVDSLLGALLENRNKLSKGQVNLSASLFSVLICIPFLFIFR